MTDDRPASRPAGLTAAEAAARLAQSGPNEVPHPQPSVWRELAGRFWGPLPWMLEVTIVASAALGKVGDALAIGGLLVFNSVIGAVQHRRAQDAVALLGVRLQVNARVLRDGAWTTIPARTVVPGDVVRVRAGDVVPADLRILEGTVEADQSTLTGESVPVELAVDGTAFSGSTITRGEATAVVTATGARTAFGKTAELVGAAQPPTHLETLVLAVVRYLVSIDLVLIAVVLVATPMFGLPWNDALPFTLVLLIASVPVALPATFTLAQAVASMELARGGDGRHGVLVTRLAAVQEAASMDILCSDKTGTLTLNRLAVGDVLPYPPHGREDLLRLAGWASDAAGQDPIDVALLAAAPPGPVRRLRFVPFDPSTKRTEAVVEDAGRIVRLVKGAPAVVAKLVAAAPPSLPNDVERLAAGGGRVIAVAVEDGATLRLAGLVGLADPPRPDSAALIAALRALGVRVKIVTGDNVAAARAVAGAAGIGDRIGDRGLIAARSGDADSYDGFAGVFPEDKYQLVKALQQAGHVVGMTGDGVNDAPALKQAEVGVAVVNATDVARRSASLVLTDPGLTGIVTAVEASRRVHRRMTTWTLNKIVKTIQVATFLTGALLWTRTFVITPTLMVLLLLTNDFVTMALGTDRVQPAPTPQRWNVGAVTTAALMLATVVLVESFLVLGLARSVLGLDLPQIRTAVFVLFVYSGLATVYVVRESGWFWSSAPSVPLAVVTIADVVIVAVLARYGILMAPLTPMVIALIGGIAVGFMFVLDPPKRFVMRRFGFG